MLMRVASRHELDSAAFRLVGLTSLMGRGVGDKVVSVGIIDGPLDLGHPAFAGSHLRTVRPDQSAACNDATGAACAHGTAVAGILAAQRGGGAVAICPGCSFHVYPIFKDGEDAPGGMVSSTPEELADAIHETVNSGVRIINLSLGVIQAHTGTHRTLHEACDHAARRGVVLVAAAGNQARIGPQPLLDHPWVIPVVGCDPDGNVTPESNLSPSIGARGLRAPAVNIPSAAPGARYSPMSGTSAATAIVTGAIALLWSEVPEAAPQAIRAAVLGSVRTGRRSLVPPLLDVEAARSRLRASGNQKEDIMAEELTREATAAAAVDSKPGIQPRAQRRAAAPGIVAQSRVIAQSGPCPTCAAAEGQAAGPPTYIFAIGQVRLRFPSASIEKEFAQTVASEDTARLTDDAVLYNVVKDNPYLANEVCWVLSVDGVETYLLVARDHLIQQQLVEAIKPSEGRLDTDVIIGSRGPMAPAEMCNGLVVPIVLVDRMYSFQKPELLAALTKPTDSTMSDDEFRRSSDSLFDRIQQLADNVGATDEHRAVNYLAVRYPQIYTHTAEMYARSFSLTRVEVQPSRMAGVRKLVNVIITYTNRNTDIEEKFRVRVDVTEKYPFLEKRLAPFFDRD